MMENNKGFSLIELLIVIKIIGVLTVLVAMQSRNAIDRASATADLSNAQIISNAIKQAMYMDIAQAKSINGELTEETPIAGTDTISKYMSVIPNVRNSLTDGKWYVEADPTVQTVTVSVKLKNSDTQIILWPRQNKEYYANTGYELE